MVNRKNTQGGVDLETHHLLELREPPESLVALRNELQLHPEIFAYASKAKSFEEALGLIGVQVNIALDGLYNGEDLCRVLTQALRNKRFFTENNSAGLKKIDGLLDAGLLEKEGTVELVDMEKEIEKRRKMEDAKILLN